MKVGVEILDMPMLGCGLDRLSYHRDLLPLLERIFRGSGISINIYLQVKKDLFRYVMCDGFYLVFCRNMRCLCLLLIY